jgi:hypothetical protein
VPACRSYGARLKRSAAKVGRIRLRSAHCDRGVTHRAASDPAANGIGVFQAAYGPSITVYDALTVPLPPL